MSRKKVEVFDAQAVAIAMEEEAMRTLIDNMRNSDGDHIAQNDAAFKIWQIANGYEVLH